MQIQAVNRSEAEKVFIAAYNNQGAELTPGSVVEWTTTNTEASQGYHVELVDAAINTVAGIGGHKVAGVVDSTIADATAGRLQVFGPANVRSSASYAGSNLMAAGSINATNIGHVTTVSGHSDHGINYIEALVGWNLEDGPNATNATVQLYLV